LLLQLLRGCKKDYAEEITKLKSSLSAQLMPIEPLQAQLLLLGKNRYSAEKSALVNIKCTSPTVFAFPNPVPEL